MVTVTNNDHHPDGGLVVPYATRRQLRQQHGPAAAAVLDVLAFHYTTDGVAMRHADVATESGMPVISVRRAIEKLCETGWVKRVYQVRGDRQIVNRYEIPASVVPDHHEHPGDRIEQAPFIPTYPEPVVDTYSVIEVVEEEVLDTDTWGDPRGSLPIEAELFEGLGGEKETDRIPMGLPDTTNGPRSTSKESLVARCARLGHVSNRNIFVRHDRAALVAQRFSELIEEATGRAVRGQARIAGFHTTARILLREGHDVAEILEVIQHVAILGLLDWNAAPRFTCMKDVRDSYAELLESLRTDVPPFAPVTPPEMNAAEKADLRTRLENHR